MTAPTESAISEEHREIWLEPRDENYGDEGRTWCEDDPWDGRAVRYVRADLYDALRAERDEARAHAKMSQATYDPMATLRAEAAEAERDDLRARMAAAEGERDEAKGFAKKLSDTLLELRPLGGSELFTRHAGEFYADPKHFAAVIEQDKAALHEARKEAVRSRRSATTAMEGAALNRGPEDACHG